MGYSPRGCKDSGTPERLHFHLCPPAHLPISPFTHHLHPPVSLSAYAPVYVPAYYPYAPVSLPSLFTRLPISLPSLSPYPASLSTYYPYLASYLYLPSTYLATVYLPMYRLCLPVHPSFYPLVHLSSAPAYRSVHLLVSLSTYRLHLSAISTLTPILSICLFTYHLYYLFAYLSTVSTYLSVSLLIYHLRKWQSTPALVPGKSHGWRSLVGCSPWGR